MLFIIAEVKKCNVRANNLAGLARHTKLSIKSAAVSSAALILHIRRRRDSRGLERDKGCRVSCDVHIRRQAATRFDSHCRNRTESRQSIH